MNGSAEISSKKYNSSTQCIIPAHAAMRPSTPSCASRPRLVGAQQQNTNCTRSLVAKFGDSAMKPLCGNDGPRIRHHVPPTAAQPNTVREVRRERQSERGGKACTAECRQYFVWRASAARTRCECDAFACGTPRPAVGGERGCLTEPSSAGNRASEHQEQFSVILRELHIFRAYN